VKPQSQISVMTIAVDEKGKLDAKVRTQSLIGIGAVGAMLTILLTGLIDGLLRSRRRRNAPSADDAPDSPLASVAAGKTANSAKPAGAAAPRKPAVRKPRPSPAKRE
jgi:hypothetical protein